MLLLEKDYTSLRYYFTGGAFHAITHKEIKN